MSQKRIKRDAFREFRLRKKHVAEHLRAPHPIMTILVDEETKRILCLGSDRERLAGYAAERGWTNYEMKDYPVVI